MKLIIATLILFASFNLLAIENATTPNDFWIHYKADTSITEVEATLHRHHLIADVIESNPFRAHINQPLTTTLEEKIKNDRYVAKVALDDTPLYPDHFYSAFGLTKEERDKWTTRWMFAVPAILIGFGAQAWDWGKDGLHMGFGNEGWFSKDSYAGGADKVGHMTSLYIETRMTTWLALQAGHDMRTAQKIGLYTGAFVAIALEVGDGFSKYRFCMQDVYVDTIGVLFATLLDRYPALDEFVGIRWQWWPSNEFAHASSKTQFDLTSDYSGQKVFLTFKAAGVPALKENIISRYLTFDIGYFTRGYEPDLTPDDKTDGIHRRYLSFGFGLNLSTLIFDTNPDSTTVRTVSGVTKYWIPPGVTYGMRNDVDN